MREGWTYKKLGECFPYIKNGANIKQIKDAKGYPITRIETLSGGVFNRDRMGYADIFDINKFQDYLIEDGDLLMSHINSKTYIV
jgi:type I restriction enzyme S subunit